MSNLDPLGQGIAKPYEGGREDVLEVSTFGGHSLKGKPKRWAVSVDEYFRVIFGFEEGHTLEIDG